jgi:para-aminobenzoate synthetase component 1
MFPEDAFASKLNSVRISDVDLGKSFIDIAEQFAHEPGTVALMSGGDLDCAEHHLLAIRPWLSLVGHGRSLTLTCNGQTHTVEADPFDALSQVIKRFGLDNPSLPSPIASGLFGYLAYDLKNHLESLPRTSIDQSGLPQLYMVAPSILLLHHKQTRQTRLCVPEFSGQHQALTDLAVADFRKVLAGPDPSSRSYAGDKNGFRSNFSPNEYEDAVRTVRDYIADGHVYQVNMSQRFEMTFQGDAFSLFKSLYQKNPAPFFAFIQAGDHQIVSTSPERYLMQSGRRVETRPIKGTRPRGTSAEEDRAFGTELQNSPKDNAELSMIVDLLRNDIGKVCRGGSVRVTDHKRLEAYDNVFHLVSVVEGELEPDKNSIDLIRATFPGGSITGCPKIRAMEIIDELEPSCRHIYTGAIGYISFHETMDLSIAIRTATVQNETIIVSAGGGIVYDSDPKDEYDETLHKGKTFMDVLAGSTYRRPKERSVWINGSFRKEGDASVPLTDLGLQYGFGFFETIRADAGHPRRLAAHKKRFNRTWRHLFDTHPPDITWEVIIAGLLERNGLTGGPAAVKILATRGDRTTPPYTHSLAVTARPYRHRLCGAKPAGVHLATYPEPRQTPLAGHKTLNYLYYHRAGAWARSRGADEALILNPDGTVSETNTANLLLIIDNCVIVPTSPAVLPGIMMGAVVDLLAARGFDIRKQRVHTGDLLSARDILITNALIGALPVTCLDEASLSAPTGLWLELNTALGIVI